MRLAHWQAVGLTALLLLGALWLNHHTPTWGDDWHRTLPVDVGLLIKRLVWEYQTWTGRLSVLLLTYLLFWDFPGHWLLFNLLNSLAMVGLIVSLAHLARPQPTGLPPARLLFCALLAIWFGSHAFGEAVLWKTGAIAYLWPALAALWLIRPFVERLADEPTPRADGAWQRWALPWAYAALALALENLSVAMLALMLLSIGHTWQRRESLPLSAWTALAGQALGTAALLLAPGNWARFHMQDDGDPLYVRLPALASHVLRHFIEIVPWLPLLVGLFLIILLLGDARALRRAWAWLIFAALSALAMVGSTGINFGARTAFIAEVFVGFSALILVAALLPRMDGLRVQLPLGILLFCLWGADALKLAEQTTVVAQQTERRAALMAEYRSAGLDRILLPSIAVPYLGRLTDDHASGRFFLRDIHDDIPGNGWRNGTYAEDHGFTFATRVHRPSLVFETELAADAASERFQLLPSEIGRLWWRVEPQGWRSVHAVYWHWPSPCPGLITLHYRLAGREIEKTLRPDGMAFVHGNGHWDPRSCAVRGEIPANATGAQLSVAGQTLALSPR